MKKKVIAAGHICIDITPVFPKRKINSVEEMLQPGKLIQMGEADVHTGGSVSNTGLGMKILGADVSLMGKVGNDAFGGMIADILKKYDVHEGLLVSHTESTSYSVVLALPEIDRIFLHNPGANVNFYADDIPEDTLSEAALFHLGYPPLMKSLYENQGAELLKIMQKARAAGAATSMDMAAVDAESEAGKTDWKMILKKVLPYVDFFVPSVEELCYMLDRERFEQWQARAKGRDITEILDIENDVRPLADQCMEMGVKVLLIKCGRPGMYVRCADKATLKNISPKVALDVDDWADREFFEKSYVPDQVLSGTGAGDTSIAAFLVAMLEGYPLTEVMHLAAATGASCVTAYDAVSGLRPFAELEKKIKAGWKKVD